MSRVSFDEQDAIKIYRALRDSIDCWRNEIAIDSPYARDAKDAVYHLCRLDARIIKFLNRRGHDLKTYVELHNEI